VILKGRGSSGVMRVKNREEGELGDFMFTSRMLGRKGAHLCTASWQACHQLGLRLKSKAGTESSGMHNNAGEYLQGVSLSNQLGV
jgi:hypothetical protein